MKINYLMICFLLKSSFAFSEKDVILWAKDDTPPYYILSGPYKGEGIGDKILKIIAEKVTEYDHRYIEMPPLRAIEEEINGRHLCSLLGGITEIALKDRVYNSDYPSAIISFKGGIYFKQNAFSKEMIDRGYVAIEELEKMKKIAAFPQQFTKFYAFLNQPQHVPLPSGFQKYKMLIHNRVDYIFSSLEEMTYYKTIGLFTNDFESLIFRKSEYERSKNLPMIGSFLYSACPRNDWGAKVISVINKFLKDNRASFEYKKANLRWIPSEHKEKAEKLYDIFASFVNKK